MNKEEQVIAGFRDLLNKLSWLNRTRMEVSLRGYKASEAHCIEYIGRNVDANVTKLAEAFYMTSGAISKLTKKLITKGLIESYRKPENRKEIYFRLTAQGEAINRIHEGLHRQFRERDKAVFEEITEAQFDSMLRFVERYHRHLDGEIRKLRAGHTIDMKLE